MTRTTLLPALMLTSLTTLPGLSLADVAGVHMGIGLWQSEADGTLYGYSLDELSYDSNDNGFVYMAIEHPIPLLPNLRLQMNALEHSGQTSVQGIAFDSKTELGSVDVIAYYELLDNWISFDLGLGVRRFDGQGSLLIGNAQAYKRDVDTYTPNLYADASFELPLTGLSVGAALQYGSFDGTEFGEYSARISYMFDSALDFGAELGLRTLDIDSIDGLTLEADYTGPYLALKASF